MTNSDITQRCVLELVERDEWYEILAKFRDATIFQTPAFNSAKKTRDAVELVVLRKGAELLAAAQVKITPVPFLRKSVAYVLWGPLFHRHDNRDDDVYACREMIRLLRSNYVDKRKIALRLNPMLTRASDPEYEAFLLEGGFQKAAQARSSRTIIISLNRDVSELRKGLDQKWRNCLNRAEKNGLQITRGQDLEMFNRFLEMYREMLNRKGIAEPGDIRRFMAMQKVLPEMHRMNVVICMEADQLCAGAIVSAIGTRGVFLFGATSDAGMKNKASYLVQWSIVEWLKKQGCTEYDLHGVSAKSNPGVYAFKNGLGGKNCVETDFLGNFDAYPSLFDKLLLKAADRINSLRKAGKNFIAKRRGFQG